MKNLGCTTQPFLILSLWSNCKRYKQGVFGKLWEMHNRPILHLRSRQLKNRKILQFSLIFVTRASDMKATLENADLQSLRLINRLHSCDCGTDWRTSLTGREFLENFHFTLKKFNKFNKLASLTSLTAREFLENFHFTLGSPTSHAADIHSSPLWEMSECRCLPGKANSHVLQYVASPPESGPDSVLYQQ